MIDLGELLARIGERDPYLACGVELPDGRDPRLLVTPAGLAHHPGALERLADAYGGRWGVEHDRCSQASFIVLDVTWYALAPLVTAYLAEEAVPNLDGAAVWLDPATRAGSLVLPPSASVEAASIDRFRDAVVRYLEPMVDVIADRRWLGRRTAWLGVGDRLSGAFEYVGGLLGDEERARTAVEALLGPSGSPLASPRHRFSTYEHRGEVRTIGLRASCCRFYRVPDNECCLTCPLVREPERRTRIADEIDAELGSAVIA